MQSLPSINQSLFVNKQAEHIDSKQQKPNHANKESTRPVAIEGELIKIGDSVSFNEAEDLFARSAYFADLPYQVQHGLNKYTEHEINDKRESIKQLMGVDLYA